MAAPLIPQATSELDSLVVSLATEGEPTQIHPWALEYVRVTDLKVAVMVWAKSKAAVVSVQPG